MSRKTWRLRRSQVAGLVLASMMVGALLGPPVASSHVTDNIKHLGNHIWEKVIKRKVFTRTQSDGRFAAKSHNHDARYVAQDTCLDGGVSRPVDRPGPGQLVITEIMPDTNVLNEAQAEWFELFAGDAMDLNGLQIGRAVGSMDVGPPLMTLASANCIEVPASSYVLFARSADSLANGGLPAVDHVFSFAFTNTDPTTLFLSSEGTVLDRVKLGSPTPGSSQQLAGGFGTPSASVNDDAAEWCDSESAYHTDNYGTPRATNDGCP